MCVCFGFFDVFRLPAAALLRRKARRVLRKFVASSLGWCRRFLGFQRAGVFSSSCIVVSYCMGLSRIGTRVFWWGVLLPPPPPSVRLGTGVVLVLHIAIFIVLVAPWVSYFSRKECECRPCTSSLLVGTCIHFVFLRSAYSMQSYADTGWWVFRE